MWTVGLLVGMQLLKCLLIMMSSDHGDRCLAKLSW
ncbi:hypothetical protein T4C_4491 [Trichinella pseudospiralis]|uniref:Uncharacterized protein n=1 Tax=Trichinella pseudospiralis TaxID=6337 RepID=A0A0V1GGM8_TRIPS|nr:hypothetical protein T4C_4491 [Trichinella pseudospiralis]